MIFSDELRDPGKGMQKCEQFILAVSNWSLIAYCAFSNALAPDEEVFAGLPSVNLLSSSRLELEKSVWSLGLYSSELLGYVVDRWSSRSSVAYVSSSLDARLPRMFAFSLSLSIVLIGQ